VEAGHSTRARVPGGWAVQRIAVTGLAAAEPGSPGRRTGLGTTPGQTGWITATLAGSAAGHRPVRNTVLNPVPGRPERPIMNGPGRRRAELHRRTNDGIVRVTQVQGQSHSAISPCQPADPCRLWAATNAKNRRAEAAPKGGSGCGYAKTYSPRVVGRQRYARATTASSPGPGTLRLARSSWRPVAHPAAARRYAVRSDHAGTRPAAPVHGCGPKSPDSHRVVWGLISRPPVPPAGFPPVSRLPTRALPLRPPSSGFPSPGVLRFRPFGRRCPVRLPVGFPPGSLPLEQPSR
jgi:hypothetical protein